ncbi:hypothetical protein QBC34DRAFT_313351 [Podospora aff. communis PSN243]|uniref:Prion-inhibition and propagation HeLo domain-containing protein n=1 Tax=Podospora aff. communis PSN243 TaxID=3040156 RepID=A0AAV9G4E8_9PEZI|nr:hypothetical protein QBC34DRAFT_313351 [Podospora aff. communis PSN243]
MSGFEVAGVVLGSIPVVISALEFYIRGLGPIRRWRRFTLELESLVLKLGTEEAKLQNVYEKLLRDIVPDDQIEPMLMGPFGPLWKDPRTVDRIRQRLWRHSKLFEANVRQMNDAMEDMKQKLNIGPDGKVRWMEASAMKKQFRRVMFILEQDEYQSLLKRLRERVSSLEELLSGNMELEPGRCRRSQATWYRLLRDLSASIYEALRSTMICACPGLHDFVFRLMSQPTVITPHDNELDVVKAQKFYLMLSFASTTLASEANLWATSRLWNLMSLSLSNVSDTTMTTTTSTTTASSAPGRRGIRFALPTPESSDTSQLGINMGQGMDFQEKPQLINNLCQAMRRSRKQGISECCGRITDGSTPARPRVFEVYPLGCPNDNGNWSPVSLTSILEEDAASLSYSDRIWLAWIITSSVLQLEGTPWLSRIPSRDTIFLSKQNGRLCVQDVFVMKRLPEAPPLAKQPAMLIETDRSAALKALGIILVEIICGQPIDRLRSTLNNTPASIFTRPRAPGMPLSDFETAMGFMDRISTSVGVNYCSAIKRCINCDIYQGRWGSGDDKEVLFGVLNLLEQDLKAALG